MDPRELSIFDITYDLPADRIATHPLAQRDASRLLIYRQGSIGDRAFTDLPDLLPEHSLLIMNNTRVVNARIVMHRSTGGRMEILILSPADGSPIEEAIGSRASATWNAMIGNGRRWRNGETLSLQIGDLLLKADRIDHDRVVFTWEPADLTFAEVLRQAGHVPLPPYMARADEQMDHERYNTVIAKHDGSIAAPTASLHFTHGLLDRLKHVPVGLAEVTLHVGAGTFLPVKADRMAGHQMHREEVRIPITTMLELHGRLGKAPIVAVGTTALRTIESLYWHGVKVMNGSAGERLDIDQWEPYDRGSEMIPPVEALQAAIDHTRSLGRDYCSGSTRLLIAPGYEFKFIDGLVTNFHQPQSTLLLLVEAFVGTDRRLIYDHALNNGYRFLSYGDGSLLWR